MEDYLEDPATGSANGDLAGYLLQHNYFNKSDVEYTVIQGEDMGRKSVLHIHASKKPGAGESADIWTIEVGGQCHVVASGEWE
jgi:trans-2,3-dihydro-3-hydroxyanthranilate isomerase